MDVKIISATQYPINTIAYATRNCYASFDKDEGLIEWVNCKEFGEDNLETQEKRKNFIKARILSGHEAILEHASITFDIKKVSRALLAQITRHRIASFCVESQRYVKYDKQYYEQSKDYIVPESISKQESTYRDYLSLMDKVNKTYNSLIQKGVPAEDARMVLPQSFFTNIVMTMNFREIRHFLKLRLDKHAQWEIRELAGKIVSSIKDNDLFWFIEDIV